MPPLTEDDIKSGLDTLREGPPSQLINTSVELSYGVTINPSGRYYTPPAWMRNTKFKATPESLRQVLDMLVNSDEQCTKSHFAVNPERYFANLKPKQTAYQILMLIQKGDLLVASVEMLSKFNDRYGIPHKKKQQVFKGAYKGDPINELLAKEVFNKLYEKHFSNKLKPKAQARGANERLVLNINLNSGLNKIAGIALKESYKQYWESLGTEGKYIFQFSSVNILSEDYPHTIGVIELREINNRGVITAYLYSGSNQFEYNLRVSDDKTLELPVFQQELSDLYVKLKYKGSNLSKVVNILYKSTKPLKWIFRNLRG